MKKLITGIFLFSIVLILQSCSTETPNIVISKVFDATNTTNNVIELYNPTGNSIDASKLSIWVYNNGSSIAEEDRKIYLQGTIEARSYYIIVGNNPSEQTLKTKADFIHIENLPFNGNDTLELRYRDRLVDQFGFLGFDINFSIDLTMIRLGEKENYQRSTKYKEFDFIAYNPDLFQYIGNDDHEIKTLEDLYAGPQLEARFLSMTYEDPQRSGIGLGGAVLVTNTGIADGDTAYFSGMNGYPGGSMRYFYLNTPEVDGSNVSAEPWGYVASKYNKEYLLKNANQKEIRVQSIPGQSLTEGYGRNLGLVWVNGALSQFLIVSEGLSESVGSTYHAYDRILTYKHVPYLTFLRFAEARAVENGWATKGFPSNPTGEKSPDWNYTSNRNTTTNPVWTPHLTLPWE